MVKWRHFPWFQHQQDVHDREAQGAEGLRYRIYDLRFTIYDFRFAMAAACEVVVDHAGGLHKRIANCSAY